MKLLKYLLASLAFVAVSAQANTISTTVLVDNFPTDQEVAYINFNVSDSGFFNINAIETSSSDVDPYIYLFAAPVNSGNFIEADDDGGSGNNSFIDRTLAVGNYVLAVSTFNFSLAEAIGGYNDSVNFLSDGDVFVQISSENGFASFGHTNPSAVPVPAAAWLFGSALLGFAGFRRKSI